MFGVFFTGGPVECFADVMECDVPRFVEYFNFMLEAGCYLAPSAFESGFVSAAHSEADIDKTIEMASHAFAGIAKAAC